MCAIVAKLCDWKKFKLHFFFRELKRIGSISRSPIYEHFTETLSGYMIIRAFRESKRFIAENDIKLDRSQRAEYNGMFCMY